MLTIDEQVNNIKDFLCKTHPSLLNRNNDVCIEIRPISRESDYDFRLSKPLNIWKFDDKSTQLLKGFLKLHRDRNCCLYYSIFMFDYNVPTKRKGYITSSASLYTEELVLDFDNIDISDYFKYDILLQSIGINGLWIFTGHGYHLHILLNEKIYEQTVLQQIVYLMKSKGFNVDLACVDTARIMRLPFTYNYKKIKEDDVQYCNIVKDSYDRYDFKEVIEKIANLKTIDDETFNIFNSIIEKKVPKTSDTEIKVIDYPYINNYDLPLPIKKMLNKVEEGYRNLVLGFLIRFFKQYLKISKTQIEEILNVWGKEACIPNYDNLNIDFERLYNLNGLNYSAILNKKYGFLEFNQIQDKSDIFISNDILNNLTDISGKEFKAYLSIHLLEHLDKSCTIDNIANVLNISTRALNPTLLSLSKTKHVFKVKNNRRENEKYTYQISKIVNLSNGYIKLSFSDIKLYLNELSNNEIKLYLYLKSKCFKTGTTYSSQETIGNKLNLKQNTISVLFKGLEAKDYVSIRKTLVNDNISYNTYTLLR